MSGRLTENYTTSDSSTLKIVSTLKAHNNDVLSVQWTGSSLASGSADKSIRIWKTTGNVDRHVELKEPTFSPIKEHLGHVQCVTFSSFGTVLATCGSDGRLLLWNCNTGEQIAATVFPGSSLTALRCCRISHDGRLIAAAGDGDAVALWLFDKPNGNLILQKVFSGHEATITSICFTHDSKLLLSASIGNDIRVWDCVSLLNQSLCVWRDAHDLGCSCMDLAPYHIQLSNNVSAYHVATGGYDNIIRLWHLLDRTSKTAVKLLPGGVQLLGHSADICSVRFAHYAKLLVSCSSDRTFIVWDPVCSSILHRVGPISKHYIRSVCFSSDDRFVMAGFSGGMIGFWALSGGVKNGAELDSDRLSPTLSVTRSLEDPALLDDSKAPDEFLCPITQEIMRDPHVALDGISYEKEAIEAWLKTHETSPQTNLVLASRTLISNINLKCLIIKWAESTRKDGSKKRPG